MTVKSCDEIMRIVVRGVMVIGPALGVCFVSAGCQTNVATGRSQFNSLSTRQEINLGEQAMPELVKQYGGRVDDAVLNEYVTRVGMSLVRQTEVVDLGLPWEFTLLDSEVINAFALPGGKVFMSRGLMARMTNEAQLAGVLGHEIGHVTAQHVDERITSAQIAQYVVTGVGIATEDASGIAKYLPTVVSAGGQGYLLKFSRDQESEADSLGMRYMARAGYNPHAQRQVMQILKQAASESPGGRSLEMLSTHPYPETRIRRINDGLERIYWRANANPDLGFYEERFERTAVERLKRLKERGTKE